MPTCKTSIGWRRGLLVGVLILIASVTTTQPVSWNGVPNATGYRICWSVYLQNILTYSPWWNEGVPFRFWGCNCVEANAVECWTGRCWAPTSLVPDPPPGQLYIFTVTAYNTAGESPTEHGPILTCN